MFPGAKDGKAVFSCGAQLNCHGVEMYWIGGVREEYTCTSREHDIQNHNANTCADWSLGQLCYCFFHEEGYCGIDPNMPDGYY